LQVIQEERILRLQVEDPRNQVLLAAKAVAVPESRLFVYRLRHARAPRLASTLQAIFGSAASQSQLAHSASAARNGGQLTATTADSGKTGPTRTANATASISAT